MVRPGRISLLIGMVTGAITGLLFAPSKGEELRKNIAKERQSGGMGHVAIAHDIGKMANDLGNLLQKAAQSNEAKKFWLKTNSAVEQWTGGTVELDEWTKQAHTKLAQLSQAVNKYAEQQRPLLTGAKAGAKKMVRKAKSGAKKMKSTMKKAASTASAKAKPSAKKKAVSPSKAKKPTKTVKKSTAKKSTSKKKK